MTGRRLALVGLVALAGADGVRGQEITASQGAKSSPSAEEIVDRYVEAIGGRAAILAQPGRHAVGTVRLPGMGIEGRAEYFIAPGRYLADLEMAEAGSMRIGYDGEVGWMTHELLGPSVLEGRQLAQVRESARLTDALHEGEEIASMKVRGKTEFEGRTAWEVAIRTRYGEEYSEYFDAGTGLLIGQERDIASPMGDVPTTIVLEDYRPVGGVRIPFTRREKMMGVEQITTIEEVRAVAPPADVFDIPAELRTLIEQNTDGPEGRDR